jgi:hypothetical protein
LKLTAVAPMKFAPVMTTRAPAAALVGVKLLTRGATVKLAPLVPVPAGAVTLIIPLVAPVGTVAAIDVAEVTVNVALVPLKATAEAPVKLRPVIVTAAPGAPLVGVNELTIGATVKLPALVPVPPAFVTEIVPLVALVGTVAVICVAELTV